MKPVSYLACLLLISLFAIFPASAKEGMNPDADYGFGVTGGFLTGSGFYLRKYFSDNYVQLGGLASAYIKGDEYNRDTYDWNVALTVGRYLNKTYFKRVGFPVGFHAFVGVHSMYEKHSRDDVDYSPDSTSDHLLFVGPGFGVDFFNPATRGFGMWITASYAAEFDMNKNTSEPERVSFYGSSGLSYNW